MQQQLGETYEQLRHQSAQWQTCSIIVAILGGLILFGAVILMFFGYVTAAAVTSAVGIISEGFSAVFVRLSTAANKRVDDSRAEQYQATSIQLAEQYKAASIRFVMDAIADMKMKGITLNDTTVKTLISYMAGSSTNGDSDELPKVQQFMNDLQVIGNGQRKVKELKDLHNSVNDLEYVIDPLKEYIGMNINKEKSLDVDYMEVLWGKATPVIAGLNEFSMHMKYLSPQSFGFSDILGSQKDFHDSLAKRSSIIGPTGEADKAIYEIISELLGTCHTQMFFIDRELKKEIDKLDKISYYLRKNMKGSDDDDSTIS